MVSGMVVLVVAASRDLSSNYRHHRCLHDRDQSGQYREGLTSASRSDMHGDLEFFRVETRNVHLSAHHIEAVDHGRDI